MLPVNANGLVRLRSVVSVSTSGSVDAQIHRDGLRILVRRVLDQGVDDGIELVTQEDGDDGGRRFVAAEAMIVARGSDGHAQKLLVAIDRFDRRDEEHEEAQIGTRIVAGIEQVLAIYGNRPVVMLARTVDALERLLVEQAHKPVMRSEQAHLLHGEQVLVNRAVRVRVNRRELMLCRGDLVVLRARGDAERPQLVVELLHELVDGRADRAEVVLLELLALARRIAEQRASRKDQVLATCVFVLGNQEELLLGADGDAHALRMLTEQRERAPDLRFDGVHRTQKRGLLVERLARVAAACRGDAQHLILDERVARGIPCRVAARIERGAQTARREARRIGLALDELLA